jgi:hypothetical protein
VGGATGTIRITPELIGSWNWANSGREWYILHADGTGRMLEAGDMAKILWGTKDGVFYVCRHPQNCANGVECIGPTTSEYTIDGNKLTLTSGERSYDYVRATDDE